jgi:hypothetical protein
MTTNDPQLHRFNVSICHQVHDNMTVAARDKEAALEMAFKLMDAALGSFTLVDATASRASGAEPVIDPE